MTDNRNHPTSIRFPLDLHDALEQHIQATGETKSEVLSQALRAYFGLELSGQRSIYDRLSKLEQRVEAIENVQVSTAPRVKRTGIVLTPGGVTGSQLAKLFGLTDRNSVKAAKKKMTPDEFKVWSAERDPQKRAWSYRDGKYFLVEESNTLESTKVFDFVHLLIQTDETSTDAPINTGL